MSKTRQIIQIEVTWAGWQKLRLNALIAWLATANSQIVRLTVKEIKK